MDKKEFNELEAFQNMAQKAQELEKKLSEATGKLQGLEEKLANEENQRQQAERELSEARGRLNPERAPRVTVNAPRYEFESVLNRSEYEFTELLKKHMEAQRPGSYEDFRSKEYIRAMKQLHKSYNNAKPDRRLKGGDFAKSRYANNVAGAAYVAKVVPLLAEVEAFIHKT